MEFDGMKKLLLLSGIFCLSFVNAVYAGQADIPITPILELMGGKPDKLIASIRTGETKIDDLITVYTEADQKNLPMRMDMKLTPLCAVAFGGFGDVRDGHVKAIKQLIELGADVNSLCVYLGMIINPLEMAFGTAYSEQEKENEMTELLKSHGAKISDGWIEMHEKNQKFNKLVKEERSKQAMENLKILAGIGAQLMLGVTSQKMSGMPSLDANKLTDGLMTATSNASEESKQRYLREQQETAEGFNKKWESLRITPLTHALKEFFPDLKTGQSWCSGTLQLERLITTLKSKKATLVRMMPCECGKAGTNTSNFPYVCGIPYSYKTHAT